MLFGRFCTGSLVIASLLVVGSAGSAAALPFFDFYGYSYADGPFFAAGTRVSVPSLLNEIQPDPIWPLDFGQHEYTVWVEGLEVAEVESYGSLRIVTFAGGTIGLYRDAGRNAAWEPSPPNAQVPSSFTDGVAELTGVFTEMVLIFDVNTGVGTVNGVFDWTGGAMLGELAQAGDWTYFGGVSNHSGLGIPSGYDLAWDPQIYGSWATPVSIETWGSLKHRYRNALR